MKQEDAQKNCIMNSLELFLLLDNLINWIFPRKILLRGFVRNSKKHQYLTDTQLIDRLVFQGRSELIDTINMFKTRSHVVRILQPNDKPLEQYHLLEDKNDVLTAFFKPGLAKLGDENIDFFSTFKEK